MVQINIAADVSCPANKKVLISSHICLSTSGPYSDFGTSARTLSKISACGLSIESFSFGTAVAECFVFQRFLINLVMYAFSFFTLDLCSKNAFVGKNVHVVAHSTPVTDTQTSVMDDEVVLCVGDVVRSDCSFNHERIHGVLWQTKRTLCDGL